MAQCLIVFRSLHHINFSANTKCWCIIDTVGLRAPTKQVPDSSICNIFVHNVSGLNLSRCAKPISSSTCYNKHAVSLKGISPLLSTVALIDCINESVSRCSFFYFIILLCSLVIAKLLLRRHSLESFSLVSITLYHKSRIGCQENSI
jgi:hypothetical protein